MCANSVLVAVGSRLARGYRLRPGDVRRKALIVYCGVCSNKLGSSIFDNPTGCVFPAISRYGSKDRGAAHGPAVVVV